MKRPNTGGMTSAMEETGRLSKAKRKQRSPSSPKQAGGDPERRTSTGSPLFHSVFIRVSWAFHAAPLCCSRWKTISRHQQHRRSLNEEIHARTSERSQRAEE